jgi:hypothetical protein
MYREVKAIGLPQKSANCSPIASVSNRRAEGGEWATDGRSVAKAGSVRIAAAEASGIDFGISAGRLYPD